MSTTLTNGLKLPDKGSVDWYADMQSNYAILDGAVGTVAEHTSQIAGKAPAVHTHSKSDITDFPAYGNAAGTICEGNDSRLSDARTPVAHTHGKSDVTDLLNSNFIPSANNVYDLGSSSYQWNNLYAKNYYYNGTAWGLDKANVWSDNQTVLKNSEALYVLKRSNLTLGDPIPQTTQVLGTFAFTGSDGANAGIVTFRDGSNGDTSLIILARQRYNSNGDRDPSGFQYETRLDIGIDSSRNRYIRPNSNGDIDLGTSTNKWKTFNGVNPGALSLPDLASDGYIDLSDNISANTEYSYTPTVDGWLALYCQTTGFHAENAVGIFTGSGQSNSYRWACSATSAINLSRAAKYHGAVMLPVKAGLPYLCWITINSSTTLSAKRLYFYKATGNV